MADFALSKLKVALDRIPAQFEGKVVKAGFGLLGQPVYEGGASVTYVAAIQEFGAPARSIPARPFMKPASDSHKSEWGKTLGNGAKAVLHGSATGDAVLEGVGLQMQGDIQTQIEATDSPPLSDVTLLLRKWRRAGKTITGKTVGEAAAALKAGASTAGAPTTPLRDTGLLVASVTYRVGQS
ncbi:MAG: hypothetical protein FWF20_12265 [Betaproteobacteria bacterium]|nr:hypothetical protein [Betaproteobacteria bacterium]